MCLLFRLPGEGTLAEGLTEHEQSSKRWKGVIIDLLGFLGGGGGQSGRGRKGQAHSSLQISFNGSCTQCGGARELTRMATATAPSIERAWHRCS